MQRLYENDKELYAIVEAVSEEEKIGEGPGGIRSVVALKCKHCPRSWEVLMVNGTTDKGTRNALLAHAAVHVPGYRPTMRRRG